LERLFLPVHAAFLPWSFQDVPDAAVPEADTNVQNLVWCYVGPSPKGQEVKGKGTPNRQGAASNGSLAFAAVRASDPLSTSLSLDTLGSRCCRHSVPSG
jgi:hypothetical protein